MKRHIRGLLARILKSKHARKISEEGRITEILDSVFAELPEITVVQVGANGFTLDDPIEKYLSKHTGKIYLIEPVDYCCRELQRKYSERPKTRIIESLITQKHDSIIDFFYVAYEQAVEMSAYGPKNNWAMGQGSFSRETIEMWIDQNSFRGAKYKKNINDYKRNIVNSKVKGQTLASLFSSHGISENSILVVDVQGAELDVLQSLADSPSLPNLILYECDSSTDELTKLEIERWRKNNGYITIGSANDALLVRVKKF